MAIVNAAAGAYRGALPVVPAGFGLCTLTQFGLGLIRLGAFVLPAFIAARALGRLLPECPRCVVVLTESVLVISLVLMAAETLGVASLMRSVPLIAFAWVLAAVSVWFTRDRGSAGRQSASATVPRAGPRGPRFGGADGLSAAIAVVVLVAQWCLVTADSLGAGMYSFDSLWYHMPFAARFAQTGSVTGVQFTQADPLTAYYPANSELLHGVGITLMHGDLLSPLMNLLWMGLALLAGWCIGRPWQVQRQTLLAACLVLAIPVMAGSQPGQAYNDVAGLAMLLAAAALVVNVAGSAFGLGVAGLALGFAVGTKVTFLVPALVIVIATPWLSPMRRSRSVVAIAGPLLLTGGWWYARNLVAIGNPFGVLSVHIGPVVLGAPSSSLASSQESVISQLGHLSLWTSRFGPGLLEALGPVWPALALIWVLATASGLVFREPRIRMLAVVSLASALGYLLLPTGATGIRQGSALFSVNLRYATPALAFGLTLAPILASRRRRAVAAVGPGLLLLLLLTQLDHSLWPTRTGRHAAALGATCAVAAAAVIVRGGFPRKLSRGTLIALSSGSVVLGVGAAWAVQRHYFAGRYRHRNPTAGLSAIYSWAQRTANTRIALYGTWEQYPLYGARDTNYVDYMGVDDNDGGYAPVPSCQRWRKILTQGRYRYVVLTASAGSNVQTWTETDPAASLVLAAGPGNRVFKLSGPMHQKPCP